MAKALDEVARIKDENGEFTYITMGVVEDTNDPQQMGRVRVVCPLFGDGGDDPIENIPWATYVSPLGGTATTPSRGRADDVTAGHLAYGMFNVPKVGTSVIVACVDGDPRFRVWMGCVHDQFLTHTTPHGRYSYKTTNKPEGPFSSTEDKIQPLYDSQTQSFTRSSDASKIPIDDTTPVADPRLNFEFRTRAADVGFAGINSKFIGNKECSITELADDVAESNDTDDYLNTQGYRPSRVESEATSDNTDGVLYDPQMYSWSTPGFHAMSMSDNSENCRIRFRSTHGHQIILDDTNERIYVSTASGKCWIEMDENGNMDIYAERNLSFHAEKDINFTTEAAFRVKAKEGIHLESETEIRLHSKEEMHIKSVGTLNLHTDDVFNIYTALDTNVEVLGSFRYESWWWLNNRRYI